MDHNAIDLAMAAYKAAAEDLDAAEKRLVAARDALVAALNLWPSGATQPERRAPTLRAVPSRPKVAAKASGPRPISTEGPWSPADAKAVALALDGYGTVLGQIISEGGAVDRHRLPSTVEGEFISTTGSAVSAALAAMRSKARKRGLRSDFIAERDTRIVVDPGFVTAYRAWMEPHREPRAHRVAVDSGAA